MTTTARDSIYRALRLLGVSDPEETPSAAQAEFGLYALNKMAHGWKGKGVDVFGSYTPDWTLDSVLEVTVPRARIGDVEALLAVHLQPEYVNSVISPSLAAMASQGWTALVAAYTDSSVDSDLTAPNMFQRMGRVRRGGWYQG